MNRSCFSLLLASLLNAFSAAAQWQAFAPGTTNNTVVSVVTYRDTLYAAGLFTQLGGATISGLGRWDGQQWQPAGGNLFREGVHQVLATDSALYVARYEMGRDSNYVYRRDRHGWTRLGPGFALSPPNPSQFYTASLYDLAFFQGELFVCGEFDHVGQQPIRGIARWDGTRWQPAAGGLHQPMRGNVIYPHQLLEHQGQLYVCGNFQRADTLLVNGAAAWDGNRWRALGTGFDGTVYALGTYGVALWAGGDFDNADGQPARYLAQWNGTHWQTGGFDLAETRPQRYGFVHTLRAWQGKLYIAGGFNEVQPNGAATLTVGSIVAFDGSTFDALGGGADNDVEAVGSWQNQLLIGGYFTHVGAGIAASRLAVYAPLTGLPSAITPPEWLSPNPVGQQLRVRLPLDEQSLIIRDLQGRVVLTPRLRSDQTADVGALAPGVYVVETCRPSGQRAYRRFVKE